MKITNLAAQTPTTRLRYLDAYRALAILAVVIGHWTIMTVWNRDGEILGFSVLPHLEYLWPFTWLFQVMPLFFLVGGIAGGMSWSRAKSRGSSMAVWWLSRLSRLMIPALIVLGFAVIGALVALPLGVRESLVLQAVDAVTMPMWFLVVYLLLILLTPAMYWLHQRFGLWVIAIMMALVIVGDSIRLITQNPYFAYLNHALVWLIPYQIGFAWQSRRHLAVSGFSGGADYLESSSHQNCPSARTHPSRHPAVSAVTDGIDQFECSSHQNYLAARIHSSRHPARSAVRERRAQSQDLLSAKNHVTAWFLFLGGLLTVILLTIVGPFPISMIGFGDHHLINTSPPTIALLALVLMQVGLARLLANPMQRLMERSRILWTIVVAINSVTMTLFVWHMVAALIGALLLNAFDRLPHWYIGEGFGDPEWWAGRITWLAVLIPILVILVLIFGRLENFESTPRRLMRLPEQPSRNHGERGTTVSSQESCDTDGPLFRSRVGSVQPSRPPTVSQVSLPITLAVVASYLALAGGLYWMASSSFEIHGPAVIPTGALALVALGSVACWRLQHAVNASNTRFIASAR